MPNYVKELSSVLASYDKKKGFWRRWFGWLFADQAAIKKLRSLPLKDQDNLFKVCECFFGNTPKPSQASYQVYQKLTQLSELAALFLKEFEKKKPSPEQQKKLESKIIQELISKKIISLDQVLKSLDRFSDLAEANLRSEAIQKLIADRKIHFNLALSLEPIQRKNLALPIVCKLLSKKIINLEQVLALPKVLSDCEQIDLSSEAIEAIRELLLNNTLPLEQVLSLKPIQRTNLKSDVVQELISKKVINLDQALSLPIVLNTSKDLTTINALNLDQTLDKVSQPINLNIGNLLIELKHFSLLTQKFFDTLAKSDNPWAIFWALRILQDAKLLTSDNVDKVINNTDVLEIAFSMHSLTIPLLTQERFDEILETYNAPSMHPTIINSSVKSTEKIPYQFKYNSSSNFENSSITLVYGFDRDRNFSNADGTEKLSIDKINKALGIFDMPNEALIEKIQGGIKVTKDMVASLRNNKNIDEKIARELLISWSDFLRENYDFISIQARMKQKVKKYGDFSLFYTLAKNDNCYAYDGDTPLYNNLIYTIPIFQAFLHKGDKQGYKKIEELYSHLEENEKDKSKVIDAFYNFFFRRTSKLGLAWSKEANLSVKFFTSFTEKEAGNKYIKACYEPITYSEHRFYKQRSDEMKNVNEINLQQINSVTHN